MQPRLALLLALAVLVACSTATPPSAPPAPPVPVALPEPDAAPAASVADPAPSASSASAPSASAPRATTGLPAVDEALERTGAACPAGMILIDGEYCSEVERKCLKQWYAASNKKDICEEYDSSVNRCAGTKTKRRYCIDTFAWPNVKGERPEVMNTFYQAMVKCAAVGKRMCTENEWTMACEGPERKPFPYGFKRDPTKCNGDQPWDDPQMGKVGNFDPGELSRLWKGVRNGAQPGCVSDYGVPDLPGNTDDVVANDSYKKGGIYARYESVNIGGPWYKGVRNACRPRVYSHNEGFAYYYLSFRCCAEADGRETDPRTPRMIETGVPFKRAEQFARFTIDDMKKKLALKAEGKCECQPTDSLCKTMCGTLLPATAVDIDLTAPRR